MKSKYLAAALLGSTLLTGVAFAETATTDRSGVNTRLSTGTASGGLPS
jgi:hypothetical protein